MVGLKHAHSVPRPGCCYEYELSRRKSKYIIRYYSLLGIEPRPELGAGGFEMRTSRIQFGCCEFAPPARSAPTRARASCQLKRPASFRRAKTSRRQGHRVIPKHPPGPPMTLGTDQFNSAACQTDHVTSKQKLLTRIHPHTTLLVKQPFHRKRVSHLFRRRGRHR